MPGFLEQLGALVSASDRNLRKFREEEWARANPGKPIPTGIGMVARKEGLLERGIRRGSEILADTLTTPGTAANQQFEGGFQAILNMLSPVDPSTGMPNVDKAGLVLSAQNMPKIRKAMEEFLTQNPDLVTVYPNAAHAMAFARAKYPKLSAIPDISFVERGAGERGAVFMKLGDYNAADNKARVMEDQTPEGLVNTIMHESFHSRQALRERPDYINEKNKYLLRASKFNERIDEEHANSWREYVKANNEAAIAGKSPKMARRAAEAAQYNYYRHKNPLEVPAFRAGDTAEDTYGTFKKVNELTGNSTPGVNTSAAITASGVAEKARMTFNDIINLIRGGGE